MRIDRRKRRDRGLANFLYVRYADDFVVLCDGTKEQAEAMRQELYQFLEAELMLELSWEKTKVTHVSEGYEFLGFALDRNIVGSGKWPQGYAFQREPWIRSERKFGRA